jgi:hypothetical protein
MVHLYLKYRVIEKDFRDFKIEYLFKYGKKPRFFYKMCRNFQNLMSYLNRSRYEHHL